METNRHYLKDIWFEDEELVKIFVAWFLDGGGEQSLSSAPIEETGEEIVVDYCEDGTWKVGRRNGLG